MKYAKIILTIFPIIFTSCSNQGEQRQVVSEDAGAPPAENREPLQPKAAFPDTLLPTEITAETSGESKPPINAGPKMRPSAPISTVPPAGLRGGVVNFVDIRQIDPSIQLDIRYATTNNFTNSVIYDCPRCLLRPETAQALARAQRTLKARGLGLKLYDCYRPRPYQQRLWDKVPNPDYVAPPEKGSMHSRGAAVDLTLVDADGNELDMGTPYDFFGPEAHYDYYQLPGQVLKNRRLLRKVMEEVGLRGIRTEWWHFSYQEKNYPLSDWVWPCEE